VKNITRKVIRTLEGLGNQQLLEDEDEEGEVERAVIQGDNRNINSTNMDKGKARAVEDPIRKVDWEIPRKAFHSSIGECPSTIYCP
jgi:diacylglycerol kinase (CTP)